MSQDFALLYSQLGLEPDCSLDELKHAYRIRVGELHPDRHIGTADAVQAHAALTELTWLYSNAIRFHRIHGRLPGSPPKVTPPQVHAAHAPHPAQTAHASRVASEAALPSARHFTDERTPPRRTPAVATLSVLVLIVVMIALHWSQTRLAAKPDTEHSAATEPMDPSIPRLELGMEEASVIAIQGAPEVAQDGVWNYGSSWVRFEDGHLVDWNSVPPNRLMTATPRPVHEEETEAQ